MYLDDGIVLIKTREEVVGSLRVRVPTDAVGLRESQKEKKKRRERKKICRFITN